jgi:hypothetical protein
LTVINYLFFQVTFLFYQQRVFTTKLKNFVQNYAQFMEWRAAYMTTATFSTIKGYLKRLDLFQRGFHICRRGLARGPMKPLTNGAVSPVNAAAAAAADC